MIFNNFLPNFIFNIKHINQLKYKINTNSTKFEHLCGNLSLGNSHHHSTPFNDPERKTST